MQIVRALASTLLDRSDHDDVARKFEWLLDAASAREGFREVTVRADGEDRSPG